ncbi:MAG: KUP/HAK/KT family potassium transporter [Bacteroidetes bacterium]|nr:KUP/HAK/KT family potassium transporter [Bacteroidota bacterium]
MLPHHINKLTFSGLVITLGIVYGDIGTSPLYVMRAIVNGASSPITPEFIYGAISCIIWTLTLQTTFKYVMVTLRADNKGEGGIFSLFALVRRRVRWVYVFALIGGAALLADGIITPSITIVSAVEGLGMINEDVPVIPIVLVIITFLFLIQQYGTKFLGKSFGPMMFLWFLMLGIIGVTKIFTYTDIFKSFNPYYAYKLLAEYPGGFLLLGAVFLCTTGAEALYSDLGHCGLKNIRFTWVFVKITLILNYLGQGAWILANPSLVYYKDPLTNVMTAVNPFFSCMPDWFLLMGIVIATAAAIIASQALISGSYTIISEAILLNFWPKVKISYPTTIKGQMYVPSVNLFLWVSCCFVILFFQKSSNMEAAYGLAITITMLMTTILLSTYFWLKRVSFIFIGLFLLLYLTIEGSFLIANINKFNHGGWVTILIAGILFIIMFVWYKGRIIKKRFFEFVKTDNYKQILLDLSKDETVPKYATNLVYLTRADFKTDIESKIIYSIINKRPKRADVYWFIHVHTVDEPHTLEYSVETIVPKVLMRVEFRLGFKVEPKINLYFRQVIEELAHNNEIDLVSHYESLKQHHIMGDFKFIVIDRIQNYDFDFSPYEQLIMDIYSILKRIGISDVKAFGLDTSNVEVEKVPLMIDTYSGKELKRVS